MTQFESNTALCAFVMSEREKTISDREWRFRLRGYGFGIKETAEGCFVTSLVNQTNICALTV